MFPFIPHFKRAKRKTKQNDLIQENIILSHKTGIDVFFLFNISAHLSIHTSGYGPNKYLLFEYFTHKAV